MKTDITLLTLEYRVKRGGDEERTHTLQTCLLLDDGTHEMHGDGLHRAMQRVMSAIVDDALETSGRPPIYMQGDGPTDSMVDRYRLVLNLVKRQRQELKRLYEKCGEQNPDG